MGNSSHNAVPPAQAGGLDILVVEDERLLRWSIQRDLKAWGHRVAAAGSLAEARAALQERTPSIVVLDIRLPDGNGLSLLGELPRDDGTQVIVMSAFGDIDTVVKAMRQGAVDFLVKPFEPEDLRAALARLRARADVAGEQEPADLQDLRRRGIVTASPKTLRVIQRLRRFAQTPRSTVLILGETGVGKSLFARTLHDFSERRDGPFVELNCAAIPSTLIESELMGNIRGAFTGASTTRRGLIEAAHHGTLFLDEIGDMPVEMQSKLLGFIETGVYRRIGETDQRRSDVRIVAATHRNLERYVAKRLFREDLYYRLRVLTVLIPPLRERPEDVDALARHFVAHFSAEMGVSTRALAPESLRILRTHDWPGNVRELKHTLEAATILADPSPAIRPDHLPPELPGATPSDEDLVVAPVDSAPAAAPGQAPAAAAAPPPPAEVSSPEEGESLEVHVRFDGTLGFQELEQTVLRAALDHCQGNQVHAARLLKISRDTLRYRMKKYGLL